jgi:hypothetical protein
LQGRRLRVVYTGVLGLGLMLVVYKGVLGLGLMLVHLYYEFALQGRRFRVVHQGVLGLGLMLVHLYYHVVLQGGRFRVGPKGVLCLGLIVVHLYYEFALPTKKLRVVYGGGVLGSGLIIQHFKEIEKYNCGIPIFKKTQETTQNQQSQYPTN